MLHHMRGRKDFLLKASISRSRRTNEARGFTLIELLVVIAIIGILASIILASLSTAQAKGRDARRVSDIKQIQLALELYYDANGTYPANIYSGSPSPLVAGGYISSMPYDPRATSPCTADGSSGCYAYVGLCAAGGPCTPTSYHLGAVLESNNSALASAADACPNTSGSTQTGTKCPSGQGVYDAPVSTNSNITDFNGLSNSANSGSSLCGKTAGTPYPGTQTCFDVTP